MGNPDPMQTQKQEPKTENSALRFFLAWIGPVVLILGLGFFIYLNSFYSPFLIDDYYTITRNFPLRDFSRLGELVSQNLFAAAGKSDSAYFRPLTQLTFALDYQLWGLTPAGYRLTNIALHMINAILVFFLAQRLFPKGPATFVSLLFVVHPVNVQAIAYISSRSDPLFFLFSVLTIYLWTAEKTALRILSLISFLLALFSKEPAVVTPVLVLLTDLLRIRSFADARIILKDKWPWYIAFATVFFTYLIIRVGFLDYPLLMEKGAGGPGLIQRIAFASKLLGSYLLLIFFPADLAFEHKVNQPEALLEGTVIAPVLLVVLLGYLACKLWHKNRAILLGLAWFAVGILPMLNLTRLNLPIMESWIYLPEVGLFIAAAALGQIISSNKSVRIALACFIVVPLSMRTVVRSTDWGKPVRLFEKNVKLYPSAYFAWVGLSTAYSMAGEKDESFKALIRARDLRPNRWYVHMSLAMHHHKNNDDTKAREELQKVLELKHDNAWAYYHLGIMSFRSSEWKEALVAFQNALSGTPRIPMLYHAIGSTELALGNTEAADRSFSKALQYSPSNFEYHSGLHIELGNLLKEKGNYRGAKREFELALRFHPESQTAREQLELLK